MKTFILLATLSLLLATSVAQKTTPKKTTPPKKPPPPKAKAYDGTLVFRTYVTGKGHKTEMYADAWTIACIDRFDMTVLHRRLDYTHISTGALHPASSADRTNRG